jgi:DNA processing protein
MFGSTPFLRNWLALSHTPGIGPAKFQSYLQLDPELTKLPSGIKPNWQAVDLDLAWQDRYIDAKILTLNDDFYPLKLKQISNPPPILYVRGDYKSLSNPQIAIVGSRSPSINGIENAKRFAEQLARVDIVVTSGMAQGIDGVSHQAALVSYQSFP